MQSPNMTILAPAGYAPITAFAFDDGSGGALVVQRSRPLPTMPVIAPAISVPLVGSTGATGRFGPFVPELGRDLWVTLSGVWVGTVRLLRSIDGGATKQGLTIAGDPWAVFTANANEAIGGEGDVGATYYVDAVLTSGTLSYRVAQ